VIGPLAQPQGNLTGKIFGIVKARCNDFVYHYISENALFGVKIRNFLENYFFAEQTKFIFHLRFSQ